METVEKSKRFPDGGIVCLERWSVSIDEELIPASIPELQSLPWVSEKGHRKPVEGSQLRLKLLPAHVQYDPLTSGRLAVVIFRGQVKVKASRFRCR